MTLEPASAADRLDSWKQIAAYLKRGVRTVRRWERDEGLPVHRQIHRVLGSVYAFRSEIDAWQLRHDERRRAARTSIRRRHRLDGITVDRRAVVHEPERRSRQRVLRRRSRRRNHRRSVPDSRAASHLANVGGDVQGLREGRENNLARARRAIPARGQRSASGQPDSDHHATRSTRRPTRTSGRRSSTAASRIVFAIQERIARVDRGCAAAPADDR